MNTRRQILGGGLAALAVGLTGAPRLRAGALRGFAGSPDASSPYLDLPLSPASIQIRGMPFPVFYTGDDDRDVGIPFHIGQPMAPPPPSESVDVAIVGGGLSGLTAAFLLRHRAPVVLEFRARFGGTSMAETWAGIPYSMGGAYVITPDDGSFLQWYYRTLGAEAVRRESFPPDPMEVQGQILHRFWSGTGLPTAEQNALDRYAKVVAYMADDGYPEIPLPADHESIAWVHELDYKTFRQDVEERMGMPLTPALAAGLQAYFYSSFCAGIDVISAAAGWNFVAAEEYGRWVFPGGNAYLAWSMWDKLRALEQKLGGAPLLRARSRVVDVRLRNEGTLVTYIDADGHLRSLTAKHVVMAGSKHICEHILPDLDKLDPEKSAAFLDFGSGAYLVANVLLDAPVKLDFYDVFLLGDGSFPMDAGEMQAKRPVMDMLRGDYVDPNQDGRSVITLYWPFPFASARSNLILEGYRPQAERLVPQIQDVLALLGVPKSAVRQVRISRWGHAVPLAVPGFIAGGNAEKVRRPLGERIHFANQDNWALPAVENSVLDARTVARAIDDALG